MQVTNPLVPPATGQAGGAAAPVANAPAEAEATKPQSASPVTASKESQRGQNEARHAPDEPRQEYRRGDNVDLEA